MATVSGWSGPIALFGMSRVRLRISYASATTSPTERRLKRFLEEARVQLTAKIQEQNTQLKKEVAERKKAQEALAESLDRYRLFSEISIEGILFHDNGIAIEVNDAFADLTECPVSS